MSKKLWRLFLVLFVIGIATTMVSTSIERVNGAEDDDAQKRYEQIYKRWTETTPLGGTMQRWWFAPDVGVGQTGEGFQFMDPSTGTVMMYSTTSMGMGQIPANIYGGWGSAFGQAAYGPFEYGAVPGVQPTPFAYSQSYKEGSIFGQTRAYLYQPTISPFGFLGGGSLGSYPPLGGISGIGSLGAWGGTGNTYGYGIPAGTGYGYPSGIDGLSGLFSRYTGGYAGGYAGILGIPVYPQIIR